jgi:hypothetical protein
MPSMADANDTSQDLIERRCPIKHTGHDCDIGNIPRPNVSVEGPCTSKHDLHVYDSGSTPRSSNWLN